MYEAYFGLRAKPFQLNPDPDFYFGSSGHRKAMAYLQYGLHQGEGFIVVTGEVGAGKTTLLAGLLRSVSRDAIVPAHIVSTQVDADDLLRLVARAFGLDDTGRDKATLLSSLSEHFQALHREGKRGLLIVDEAQNLTRAAVEELRMLSNFQVGNRALVQSFLVGQPEFRAIMRSPEMRQLKQRVIASYHLGPLSETETVAYVEHRLRVAGWRNDPSFDPGALTAIHRATGGVPRRINAVCDRMLLSTFLADRHRVAVADVDGVADELNAELDGEAGTDSEPSQRAASAAPRPTVPAAELASLRAAVEGLTQRVATLEIGNATLRSLLVDVLSRSVPAARTGESTSDR